MKVKVCGITSYHDAALALDLGVDALGFNFFPRSPRYIAPEEVRAIIKRLPPFTVSVGLFVNSEYGTVVEAARVSGVQVLQLHGDESPEYCEKLSGRPLIKVLRIGDDFSSGLVDDLERYPVHAFLLDARDDLLFGGTGKTFDWSISRRIRRVRPLILAGGLRPGNVSEAIRIVDPYAVDVCSGVESSPGRKDPVLLREFMNEVRNAV